jgi:hypothetical protein
VKAKSAQQSRSTPMKWDPAFVGLLHQLSAILAAKAAKVAKAAVVHPALAVKAAAAITSQPTKNRSNQQSISLLLP